MNEPRLSPLPEGSAWPSGDYINLATFALGEAELFSRLGLPPLHGVEAGLGPWTAVGGILPSGVVVEFIYYAYSRDQRVTLRADRGCAPAVTLDVALRMVGVSRDDLPWISPLVTETPDAA